MPHCHGRQAVADAEAREESARQTLGRSKEELRLREARHSQQITRLAGAVERVRGKWESLRNANRRVLEKKRCEIAERREALRHASSTWISVKSDLGTMAEQESHLGSLLGKAGVGMQKRNEAIRRLLDTVTG